MKKVFALLAVCLLVVMSVVPAAAATPKEDIVASAKANLPAAYADNYLPLVENVLQQIDVTADQATKVIACIEAVKAGITTDKGSSLSEYSAAEIELVMEQFNIACETLNLTYEFKASTAPQHEGDTVCVLYDASGKKLADIDGDAVRKTDVAPSNVNYGYVALAAVLMMGAVVAAVYGKKAVADR